MEFNAHALSTTMIAMGRTEEQDEEDDDDERKEEEEEVDGEQEGEEKRKKVRKEMMKAKRNENKPETEENRCPKKKAKRTLKQFHDSRSKKVYNFYFARQRSSSAAQTWPPSRAARRERGIRPKEQTTLTLRHERPRTSPSSN